MNGILFLFTSVCNLFIKLWSMWRVMLVSMFTNTVGSRNAQQMAPLTRTYYRLVEFVVAGTAHHYSDKTVNKIEEKSQTVFIYSLSRLRTVIFHCIYLWGHGSRILARLHIAYTQYTIMFHRLNSLLINYVGVDNFKFIVHQVEKMRYSKREWGVQHEL